MIIDNCKSAANRAPSGATKDRSPESIGRTWRISESQPGTEILVIPRPVRCSAVCLPTGAVLNNLLRGLPLDHRIGSAVDVLVQARIRAHLSAIGFKIGLQQGVSQSRGDGQGRFDVPNILKVK